MNTNHHPHRFRVVAAAILTAALSIAGLSSPVAAEDNNSLGKISGTPTTTVVISSAGDDTTVSTVVGVPTTLAPDSPEGLSASYRSLSAGLILSYANSAGVDVPSFVGQYGDQINSALGHSVMASGVSSVDDLQQRIVSAGLVPGAGTAGVEAPKTLAASIAGAAPSPDTISVLGNVNLANRLAGLDTPALDMPGLGVPALSNPGLVSAADLEVQPSDSLVFGLYQNQTLAQLANSAPNIFAQVTASGITDGTAQAAVTSAQKDAQVAMNAGLGASLLAPCHAVLMQSMATGNAAGAQALAPGSNCSPCAAAGVYLHSNTNRLFMPGVQGAAGDNNDASFNVSEWKSLQDWSRGAIIEQSPQARSAPALTARDAQAGSSAQQACAASSAGTSNFLDSNFGGVLTSLGG